MGGPSQPCMGRSGYEDNGSHSHTLSYILKFSHGFWDDKKRSQKIQPTFKNGSDTWWANELFIESFSKKDQTPQFHLSLRDFMDDTIP